MDSEPPPITGRMETLLSQRNGEGDVLYGGDVLRFSQGEALTDTLGFLQQGVKSGHIIQPGGTGKLHEAVFLAHANHLAGGKTLIIVPWQSSVADTIKRFQRLAPDVAVGALFEGRKEFDKPVTVAAYPSFLNAVRSEKINPEDYSLVLADEGHHNLTDISDEELDKFTHAVKIAFSATPRYYAGKELAASRHFGQLLYHLSVGEAVARKECAPTKVRLIDTNVPIAEYDRLFAQHGDESPESSLAIERAINTVPWNQTFASVYRDYVDEETGHSIVGDKAFVFCAGIQHAKDMATQFNQMLMPYINGSSRHTEEGQRIRRTLQDKGIDPDKVRYACVPVWGAMDREHGWGGNAKESGHTRHELMEMYGSGKVLMLSCDKVLTESIDIPATTTILNAVPTCSFVRAGQRGMRSSRIFNGDRMHGIPAKKWAYVFDGLPENWRDSIASPVLFSEFILQDLYTHHGAEPPLHQGVGKPPEPENSGHYRVIWDVAQLLSIHAAMEVKRAIGKAVIVPEEFLNDSLALKALKTEHEILSQGTHRFIGGLYKEWEKAYMRAGFPGEGTVTRHGISIPAAHLRFANNRLYIHRDDLPLLWQERQAFTSPQELSKRLAAEDHFVSRKTIEEILSQWEGYKAGKLPYKWQEPYVAEWSKKYEAQKAVAARVRQWNEHDQPALLAKSVPAWAKVTVDDMRYYNGQVYFSEAVAEAIRMSTANYGQYFRAQKYNEETKAYREKTKAFIGINHNSQLIDGLADLGYRGIGPNELMAHAKAAYAAAQQGEEYGGETFLPSDFMFEEKDNKALGKTETRSAYLRKYRAEQFVDALESFHDIQEQEPERFPASLAECFPAIRRASGNRVGYDEVVALVNGVTNRAGGDYAWTRRFEEIANAIGFNGYDFIPEQRGKAPLTASQITAINPKDIQLSKKAFEGLKALYAVIPSGFVRITHVGAAITKLGGEPKNILSRYIMNHLRESAIKPSGTLDIAGVEIPCEAVWRRGSIPHVMGRFLMADDCYCDPAILPKLALLHITAKKVVGALNRAIASASDTQQTVTLYGVTVPKVDMGKDGLPLLGKLGDDTLLAVMKGYFTQHQGATIQGIPASWSERVNGEQIRSGRGIV